MSRRRGLYDRLLAALLGCGLGPPAAGADQSLAELAASADLIAVAQVERTDYSKTRGYPSAGSALLKILSAYKGAARGDWIEVTERGLGADACYYPEPSVFDVEGDRFLVFLNRTGSGAAYRGRAPGCRLPVLVTDDNRYALRYPVAGLRIDDPDAVVELRYADPAAIVDAGGLTDAQRERLVAEFHARPLADDDPLAPPRELFVYTRGVPITRVRALMFPAEPADR